MVSLVMPVWKPNPEWFQDAVRSVLAERDCPIELIVVDDGSPEPVSRHLAGIDDPRIVQVRIEHGGISAARNAGISKASGQWIRFADSDDLIEPGSTSRLLELSRPDGAIAYGNTVVCDPELRPEKVIGASVQGDALVSCILGDFFVYINSMLFPRDIIASAGGFDARYEPNEDYDFVLRALEHAPVRGDDFVASRYRRHGESITGSQSPSEAKGGQILDDLFLRRSDLRGTPVERAARAHHDVRAAARLMHSGRFLASLRRLGRAVARSPRNAAPEAAPVIAQMPRLAARRALSMGRRPAA